MQEFTMVVTAYSISPSTLIGRPEDCTWPGWGLSLAAGSRRLIWKIKCKWRSLKRSNSTAWLLIILLTRYLPAWQFSSFLLGCLVNKFLVLNHTKSPILYWGAGPQCRLAWCLWSAYTISMLFHRIFWISSICMAKASALTSLILLRGDLAGSKPMQG